MSDTRENGPTPEVVDRAQGCLLGLACGDALGRPVEFKSASQITTEFGRVTEMLADGTHGKPAGTITDDTELALCIARSLVESGGFDGDDVARRFVEWYESGPFDIGLMTAEAIDAYHSGESWNQAGITVWEGRPEGQNAGNGSVMRCAPYALAYNESQFLRRYASKWSSAITHADPRCTYSCMLLNDVIASYLAGETVALTEMATILNRGAPDALTAAISELPDFDDVDALSSSGYVIDTLQTALYLTITADSAEDAICRAVNRGGDADTVGAVTGALVGARFGAQALPDSWLTAISETIELGELATQLIELTQPEQTANSETILSDTSPATPTYFEAELPISRGGHRPDPAPHQILGTAPQSFTPADAVTADWIRRVYQQTETRNPERATESSRPVPGELNLAATPIAVRVPEYRSADSFDELPAGDRERIRREIQRSVDAATEVVSKVRSIRTLLNEDPQVPAQGQLYALLRTPEAKLETISERAELLENPQALQRGRESVCESIDCLRECCSLIGALDETSERNEALRTTESALGAAQSCHDGLYAAMIRQPVVSDDRV